MLDVVAEVVSGLAPAPATPRRRPAPSGAAPTGAARSAPRAVGVRYVGVGAPGLVDQPGSFVSPRTCRASSALADAGGTGRPAAGVQFRIGNDATCAGWAEWVLGAARAAAMR